ncbi:Sensor histidine kinase RcsC [Methylobacterium iners]|uniref:histidine kinase n=1 Tax=Methylobacterium iners TaxID=418707 RepID=A0ABQ4S1T9_9HYPH|nr:Sensor histidine kinase RcsC [Methylobacterium iners]
MAQLRLHAANAQHRHEIAARQEHEAVIANQAQDLEQHKASLGEANRLLVLAEQVAHVGHWHIALPSQTLTWSDEVFRIYGVDRTSFEPSMAAAIDAYHPEDRERITACVARAIHRQEGFEAALRIVRPSGEVRHVLARGICQVDHRSEGPGRKVRSVFGVFMDVTEQKQVERALAEKSMTLEATLQSMDQGLLMIAADGTVPVANARALELLGLPMALMETQPSYRAIRDHLRESGAWGEAIEDFKDWQLDEERRTSDLRSQRRRADGSVIEIRSLPMQDGQGYVQTLTDVTRQRLAEERIRESEARYRLLADHTSDLIVLGDAEGRHSYISPAVTNMLGYTAEEAKRTGLRTLVHPEDRDALAGTLQTLGRDALPASIVYRIHHKAGHHLWVEAALRRVEEDGRVQIIESLRNVTQRQQQAVHLEQARVAAEAGARVKAEFLANMSHELRTPLTGMLGVHDLLRNDPSLQPSQIRLIGLAQEAGQSLLTLVNDILDFSKIEAGQLTIDALPFSLRDLITSCRDLAREGAQHRKLVIIDEVDEDVPNWLVGDKTRLRQILLNLLTNAIKFTRQGSVTVRVRWLSEVGGCPHLRVEVIDTGIGIAADKLPKLFERFSQADGSISRHYGGTGLGLAISRRLAQLMGGEMGVTSTLGAGSTFWFELPLMLAEPHGGRSLLSDQTLSRSQGAWTYRLLLAEDNLINQEIISAVLRQKGHEVTLVGDGRAAVVAVKTEPAFDLILMDVQMPGQDGISATQEIRQWEREAGLIGLPIVALTANAMAEEVERCRGAGMSAHVAKPVDWADLFATMDRLMSMQQRSNIEGASKSASAVVLDETSLEVLASLLGDQRIPDLLSSFTSEVRRRLVRLEDPEATSATMSAETHALVSLAGQLGFMELSLLASEVGEAAERGGGLDQRYLLIQAVTRALAAAQSSRFAKAA